VRNAESAKEWRLLLTRSTATPRSSSHLTSRRTGALKTHGGAGGDAVAGGGGGGDRRRATEATWALRCAESTATVTARAYLGTGG